MRCVRMSECSAMTGSGEEPEEEQACALVMLWLGSHYASCSAAAEAMLRLGLATPTAAATNAKALAWQLHDVLLRAAPACSRTPSPWTRQPRDRSSIAKRCQAWSSHVKDAAASIRLSSWAIGIAPAPMTDCLQPQEPQWRSPDLVFSAELHARCLAEGWCTSCHGTACLHRPSCSIHLPQWGTRACSFLWLDWRYSRATCAPRDVSRPRPF